MACLVAESSRARVWLTLWFYQRDFSHGWFSFPEGGFFVGVCIFWCPHDRDHFHVFFVVVVAVVVVVVAVFVAVSVAVEFFPVDNLDFLVVVSLVFVLVWHIFVTQ